MFPQSIPTSIRDVCSDGEDLELVSRQRIVVCTCTTAGLMYSMDLLNGHFTHAFIDEVTRKNKSATSLRITVHVHTLYKAS